MSKKKEKKSPVFKSDTLEKALFTHRGVETDQMTDGNYCIGHDISGKEKDEKCKVHT